MSKTIEVPRSYIIISSILVLIVLLLALTIGKKPSELHLPPVDPKGRSVEEGWDHVEFGAEVKTFIAQNEIKVVAFETLGGKIFVANADGDEASVCAQTIGGRVVPKGDDPCNKFKESTIITSRLDSTIVTTSSPGCIWRNYGGDWVRIDERTGHRC